MMSLLSGGDWAAYLRNADVLRSVAQELSMWTVQANIGGPFLQFEAGEIIRLTETDLLSACERWTLLSAHTRALVMLAQGFEQVPFFN